MKGACLVDAENDKKRTTVTIYGQQYTIKGDEPPEHVLGVAEYLDQKMKEFKEHNPYLDTTRLAVLTALNVVDEYIKLQEKLDRYENEGRTDVDGERG
ncbi:cell division protein ZapA [Alteribacillus persepolensis]|uniref:Cell division protein ZapA n=1 Tax=Alteribacillus persepolensis TaxID=568899 RepID=A0A1G8BMM8_9BACI|nr:cell division protein ZapA [Alteribacillus persepolensis]SDH34308.1 cell division protein ZapA [Alteribacillus persepolensis]